MHADTILAIIGLVFFGTMALIGLVWLGWTMFTDIAGDIEQKKRTGTWRGY